MVIGVGYPNRFLTDAEVRGVFEQGLAQVKPEGKKLLVIIPDGTRSGPFGLCFKLITEILGDAPAKLDFMMALGTHMPMSEEHICRHVGITPEERATRYAKIGFLNHDWENDIETIGAIPAAEIAEMSQGKFAQDVAVQINPRIWQYDHLIIVGPVFPHEIAGFSGGNKYFFPGISGPDVINVSHWLGALLTSGQIIGRKNTQTRKMIDRAGSFINMQKSCFSLVVKGHDDLAGVYFGSPEESQDAAADLSAQVNIVWLDKPYQTVLSVMPEIYDDIWTASKGMYKMEPVVADGGTIIIYAPHIDEISYTHGKVLDRVGYHVSDYFVKQWDTFKQEPWGVLAHSTLVKGTGAYENGVEKPRVNVILATGIPRERCQKVNLGYMDPATIDPQQWMGRESEGILVVPRAGELLHRLKDQK